VSVTHASGSGAGAAEALAGTDWSAWVGRQERHALRASADTVALLEATLDRPVAQPGGVLEPLRHWLWTFVPPAAPTAVLGPDGHPPRGPLIPSWPLPRRMWAGSSVRWLAPVPLDAQLEHETTIESVDVKTGRSGTLGFVVLRHRWLAQGACAIDERQTVVYRAPVTAGAPAAPSPREAAPVQAAAPAAAGGWQRRVVATEVMLFRYSAVTFNAHRIHYDTAYTTGEEGYPGLVVQGPLMATLMLDAFRDAHPGAAVRRFDFRALQPAFAGGALAVGGEPDGPGKARVWVRGADGATHVAGEVAFE
jgi:3-methylfumaryl-CoA hydratase